MNNVIDVLKKINWNTHCLISTYHDSIEKEFYIKVFNVIETVPSGFEKICELCFDCQCYEGQGYKVERHFLRCSLIGSLYKIVDIPNKFMCKQLSIFDFL